MARNIQLGTCTLAYLACNFMQPLAVTAVFVTRYNEVPTERLIKNTEFFLAENPKNAQGYYLLGRLHSLVYATKVGVVISRDSIEQLESGKLASVPMPYRHYSWSGVAAPQPIMREKLLWHLEQAVQNLTKSIELDGLSAQNHLGLAYLFNTGAVDACNVSILPASGTKELADEDSTQWEKKIQTLGAVESTLSQEAYSQIQSRLGETGWLLQRHCEDKNEKIRLLVRGLLADYWRDRAIEHYYSAFQLAQKPEEALTMAPFHGISSLISWEAGLAYIDLVRQRGAKSSEEVSRINRIKLAVDNLARLPPNNLVTPIIVSLDPIDGIDDLLASELNVVFDLDGDDMNECWPWVQPHTGILVWDPFETNKITSGRQFFGTVSWWLFFADGYQALSFLDDDRNGRLEDEELCGIAMWFDRNSNGISDFMEIVPLQELGVKWISTHPDNYSVVPLRNMQGMGFLNGRVIATFDWETKSSIGCDHYDLLPSKKSPNERHATHTIPNHCQAK